MSIEEYREKVIELIENQYNLSEEVKVFFRNVLTDLNISKAIKEGISPEEFIIDFVL